MNSQGHPEELLDAWRTGGISVDDDARLRDHARTCVACRLELAIEPGLGRETEVGPEDEAKLAAMIGAAMIELPDGPAEGSGTGPSTGGGMSKLVLAGVAVAGATAIALVLAANGDPTRVPSDPGMASPGHLVAAPEHAPVSDPERIEAETIQTEPQPQPELVAASPLHDAESGPVAGAADLLRDANTARRNKRYAKAAKLYERLAREHRASEEEVLSRVTYGTMLLDHLEQPQPALARFDAYLSARPRGTLAEEALMGRAKALGRLGRTEAEHEAWQRLLSSFPDSVYAGIARQRLHLR